MSQLRAASNKSAMDICLCAVRQVCLLIISGSATSGTSLSQLDLVLIHVSALRDSYQYNGVAPSCSTTTWPIFIRSLFLTSFRHHTTPSCNSCLRPYVPCSSLTPVSTTIPPPVTRFRSRPRSLSNSSTLLFCLQTTCRQL